MFKNIYMFYTKKRKRGFTIIEGLVALTVFIILVLVFYKIFSQSAIHLGDSKQRRGAVALANERMEHYRNFAYDNVEVTTKGGDIVADEIATVNDMVFRIVTSVNLVDDPFDGTILDETDPIWNDYKHVSVTVVWDTCVNSSYARGTVEFGAECESKRVRMISQFVPPGGLEVSPSGGVLAVNVLDEDANIVEDANITIYNSDTDQMPYENEPVDTDGRLLYVGAPSCENCYEITVEADGYEMIKTENVPTESEPVTQTIPISGSDEEVAYYPRYIHQSIADGTLTTMTFIVQKKSGLNIVAEDPLSEENYDGINLSIRGGRVLGTNLNENPLYTEPDVYNYNDDVTTDSNGELEIRTDTDADGDVDSNDETNPGLFTFFNIDLDTDDNGTDDYVFWKMVPGVDTNAAQISLNSDSTVDGKMILVDKEYEGIFFTIVDGDGNPVENASVSVYDDKDLEDPDKYELQQDVDIYGHVFFPDDSDDLIVGDEYDIVIAADGYDTEIIDEEDAVEIEEDTLVEMEIILTPSE
jgi:competence protein ComGC